MWLSALVGVAGVAVTEQVFITVYLKTAMATDLPHFIRNRLAGDQFGLPSQETQRTFGGMGQGDVVLQGRGHGAGVERSGQSARVQARGHGAGDRIPSQSPRSQGRGQCYCNQGVVLLQGRGHGASIRGWGQGTGGVGRAGRSNHGY